MALKTLELRARRDAFVVFFLGFFLVLTHFLYSQSLAGRRRDAGLGLGAADGAGAGAHAGRPAEPAPGRRGWRRAPRCSARRSWRCCSCCSRASARCGACRRTASRRPACRTACAGLGRRARAGRQRSRCACASTARRRRRSRCTSAARCCRASTAASGARRRRVRRAARCRSSGREPARQRPAAALRDHARAAAAVVLPLLEATRRAAPRIEGYGVAAREDLQSGSPTGRHRARCASRPMAYAEFRHGPTRADRSAARSSASCRPATTRARWPGRQRCARDHALRRRRSARRSCSALLQHIRTGGYSYTLAPGVRTAVDAIDEFWLDRARASASTSRPSFVVMMRAIGVPARIVTGYQGADTHPGRRLLHRAPELRPRLGRVLAARRRLGARRPDRRGRARPHQRAAGAWCRSRAWSPARSPASAPSCSRSCARLGGARTTAGTSGC